MEQTMMGDRIAFSFTAALMVIIFIVIVVSVRDNKKKLLSPSSVDAVRMPAKPMIILQLI